MTQPSLAQTTEGGERDQRSPKLLQALAELAVVGGGSLIAIFWVIPNQTASASAYGMSPSMMPIACATAIGLLAVFQFLASLLRRPAASGAGKTEGKRPGMTAAVLLVLVTCIGAYVLSRFGLVVGGIAVTVLVSLVIGEFRLLRTGALCCAVAGVMLLIDLSGL
ncbi:MAG: hypothetical protein ACFB13_14925 [Kiloniellaceae bacterium]